MSKRFIILLMVLLLPISASAQIIKISGSTTLKRFVEPAAEAYVKVRPEVLIDIHGGGSSVGIASTLDGSSHLGMVARKLTSDEESKLVNINQVTIAVDAVAVIISNDLYFNHHLHALKKEDIAAIYRGEINNWQMVGGPDRDILVVDKQQAHGTRQVFASFVLGDEKAPSMDQAVIVGPNRHMQILLEASNQAIGILSTSNMSKQYQAVEVVVDGKPHAPSEEEIRSRNYPLSRFLTLLVPQNAPEYVHDFVAFLNSPEAKKILEDKGLLSPK